MAKSPFTRIEPEDNKKKKSASINLNLDISSVKKKDEVVGFQFNPEILLGSVDDGFDDDEEQVEKPKRTRKKAGEGLNLMTDTGDESQAVDESRKYEDRFKCSLDNLDSLTVEVTGFKDEVKVDLDALKSSKQRGVLTHITNQTSNMVSLYKSILDIHRERTGVLKTISDLEMKANAKGDANGKNDAQVIDKLFSKVLKGGSAAEQAFITSTDREGYGGYTVDNALKNRTAELITSGELQFTDNEMAVEYEGSVKMYVLYSRRTREWRLAAIDVRTDQEIPNYPLPPANSIGAMSFDTERGIAKDKLNRVYDIYFVD